MTHDLQSSVTEPLALSLEIGSSSSAGVGRSCLPWGTRSRATGGEGCGQCLLCPHATCITLEQVPGLDSLRDAWLREAAVEAAAAEAAAAALTGATGVAGPAETRAAVAAVVRAAGAASDAADALGAPPCGSCKECRTPCQARLLYVSDCVTVRFQHKRCS